MIFYVIPVVHTNLLMFYVKPVGLTPAGELLIMSSEDGELQIVTPAIGENGQSLSLSLSLSLSDIYNFAIAFLHV